MNRLQTTLATAGILLLAVLGTARADTTVSQPLPTRVELTGVTATVAFSPNGGGQDLVIAVIRSAKSSLLMQAYEFTDRRVVEELVAAKQRGVDVRVLVDASNTKDSYSVAGMLANRGVPVWVDTCENICHSKVLIVDVNSVETGSYNYTVKANKDNSENVLWLQNCPALAAAYLADWNWRAAHATPLRPSGS